MRFGVDEAGKGPVLGSMFAAAVRAPPVALPDDVDDSKRLAPERRERMAATLRDDDRVDIGVAEIPVERIDGGASDATRASSGQWPDGGEDMNTLTVAAQAEALDEVAREGDGGVCDAGDTDADRFGRRVADRLSVEVDLRAEHGADGTYAHVAAASVVAKVERDAHVAALDAAHPGYDDLGSGYPSDPATKSFLRAYLEREGELPACARRSWSTCDDLLAEHEQSDISDF